ncbi:odorant receptor 217 [Nasonia vitripennis]|uniref:Odorant receptor n=1 Tax=Nasonia vitripennis TaxID=7425 RepID=A0A7M6UE35_NASVI|nr:odorant receptor 217 [Nasonia vitripennis]
MGIPDPENPLAIFYTDYYKYNRKLLEICGLWPELSRPRKIIMMILFALLMTSLIIPMGAGAIHYFHKGRIMYVVEDLIGLLYLTVASSKYFTYSVFEGRILRLYHQVGEDWRTTTDEEERKILQEYSEFARLLSIIYFVYAAIGAFYFNMSPYLPLGLDRWMPLESNESRVRIRTYHPYYFDLIDAEKYYYECYFFHGNSVVYVSTMVGLSVDSMTAFNVQHICALFHIVGHRLRKIGSTLEINAKGEKIARVDDITVVRQIKHVCGMHRTSIDSVELLQSSFGMNWLVFLIGTVTGIALLMFDLIFSMKHPLEKMTGLVIFIGIQILIFYINWIAQKLTDSTEQIFLAACETCWYNLSVKGQKLVYFMMQKNIIPLTLTAGGIAELNFQQFASVSKTSMSYAMVILQMNDE